jgi:hypothetical protein
MVQGSCLCGGVAFEVSGEIGMVSHCHCAICRKTRGAAFSTDGAVTTDGFRWLAGTDLIQRYASSPESVRPFCRRCGSAVPIDGGMPGFVFVPLGNLDGDPRSRPLAHMFVGSKARWYEIADDLPRFDEFPPGFENAVALPDPPRPPAPAGTIGGSCLCGQVAYQVEGAIELIRHCHCSRCRRARSAAHASNGFVDPAKFRFVRGEEVVESYKVPDAERFMQHFCRECGSILPRALPNRPYTVIPMGSVDDDPIGRPSVHIFVDSKAPWFEIADALRQYPEYPPQ